MRVPGHGRAHGPAVEEGEHGPAVEEGERGGRAPGLVVDRLGVALPSVGGDYATVLHEVDLQVPCGRVVVLLGPSGAGKSTTLSALLGLLPAGALVRGRAEWDGGESPQDLLRPDGAERERLRGRVVAWLPQAPLATLTPVMTVGAHLREKARVHVAAAAVPDLVERAVRRHDVEPSWQRRLPGQLSGGQAQRVSNALALMGRPGLVLADEPTAGLDARRTRATANLLRGLARDEGRAVLVVTHDLSLAEQVADHVVVLDAGRTVDRGPATDLVRRARVAGHQQVAHRTPREALTGPLPADARALRGERLTVVRGHDVVLRDVDVHVPTDRTTGLMAPSGAGKTTLLRTLALLHPPRSGRVLLDGTAVGGWGHRVPAAVRRRIGFVAQDPRTAVDARWTVRQIVAEPLRLAPGARRGRSAATDERVVDLLTQVGLPPDVAGRHPDAISGGQLQRVVVARALALDPDYLLLDEPTSMVDAQTAADVLAAVHRHQHASGCGVLVASHDEELLRRWCDTVVRWDARP